MVPLSDWDHRSWLCRVALGAGYGMDRRSAFDLHNGMCRSLPPSGAWAIRRARFDSWRLVSNHPKDNTPRIKSALPCAPVAVCRADWHKVVMKITSNTASQLVINHSPWMWGILITIVVLILVCAGMITVSNGSELIGLVLLGFAAALGVVFRLVVVRTQLFFHAPFGILEIRQRKVRGGTKEQILLRNLSKAIVQTMNGDQPTHRLALVLKDGTKRAVTEVYSSGSSAHKAAEAINAWLARVDSVALPD